jgi:hypothetical protein
MYLEWAQRLTQTDEEQVLAILNAVASKEGTNGIPRPLTAEEGAKLMSSLARGIRYGECHQLFARRGADHRIIGVATLEQNKIHARSHVADVKRMAMAPEVRSFAGRCLLAGWRAIMEKCRELGCDIINIDVSEDGPHELWQRLGFRVYARIDDYARVGERRLEGYFMHVYLSEAEAALERFSAVPRASAASPPLSHVLMSEA